MLEKSSQSFFGAGCREFESRHLDQKTEKCLRVFGFLLFRSKI